MATKSKKKTSWVRFFLGTPKRLTTTAAILGLIIVTVRPGLLRFAAEHLVAELAPLLGPALSIIIVFAGIRMILFGKR